MIFIKSALLVIAVIASNAYELKTNKTFNQELLGDRIVFNFSLTARKSSAKETKELIHSAISFIKKQSHCGGGSYILSPEYIYKDTGSKENEKKLIGFAARADFECRFTDAEETGNITTFLDAQKEIEIHQAPIRWVVDEKRAEIAKEELELEAIRYSKKYIQQLKDKNIAQCKEKKIEIITNSIPIYRTQGVFMSKSSMETPTNEPKLLSIGALYSFKCE